MEHVLSNTIAALMEYPNNFGISLLTIPKILTDGRFRPRVRPILERFFAMQDEVRYTIRRAQQIVEAIANRAKISKPVNPTSYAIPTQ